MIRVRRLYMALVVAGLVVASAIYWQRPFRVRMASFVTDLQARTPEQRRNIEKTGKSLSDVVLQSGESFSLNQHAGPYTTERGFLPERSFFGKAVVNQPGGGVCQVASTLYNAAVESGLQILERVPHSQEVSSVPKGRDATLAYGVADLKLKNPYPFPVQIRSRVLTDQLLIEIWGKEPPNAVASF